MAAWLGHSEAQPPLYFAALALGSSAWSAISALGHFVLRVAAPALQALWRLALFGARSRFDAWPLCSFGARPTTVRGCFRTQSL